MWFQYPAFRRRASCPKCELVARPSAIGVVHRHGRWTVVLVPRMVRVPLYPAEDAQVEAAVVWLEGHWRGEVSIPEELRGLAAVT